MNILILGLGALGIVFAVALKSSGNNVFGVTKEKYLERFKNKPLKIKGLFGERETFIDGIYANTEKLIDLNLDLIIVSVKSYDTEKAINQIKSLIKEKTLVLLAQN
ncbi:MAG: 2-dehydropantoate 2-reductase, partial [Candidatus Omnitrophica bacterium]|nr:2-dehydropantoate 2-reductase [Candidatus Omnitrophota bacterium]